MAGATFSDGLTLVSRAWFAGFDEEDACLFGVNESLLTDATALVGTLAHEVAHAYREHVGLTTDARDEEERLTDLTTVYLGFGILTTNASFQYASRLLSRTVVEYSRSQAGYLTTEAMAFLLALQMVRRRANSSEVARIRSFLGPRQSGAFDSALKYLRGRRRATPGWALGAVVILGPVALLVALVGSVAFYRSFVSPVPVGYFCERDSDCAVLVGQACYRNGCAAGCERDTDCASGYHCHLVTDFRVCRRIRH